MTNKEIGKNFISAAEGIGNVLDSYSNLIRCVEDTLIKNKIFFPFSMEFNDHDFGKELPFIILKWHKGYSQIDNQGNAILIDKSRIILQAGDINKPLLECNLETRIKALKHFRIFLIALTETITGIRDAFNELAGLDISINNIER